MHQTGEKGQNKKIHRSSGGFVKQPTIALRNNYNIVQRTNSLATKIRLPIVGYNIHYTRKLANAPELQVVFHIAPEHNLVLVYTNFTLFPLISSVVDKEVVVVWWRQMKIIK